MIKFVDDDAANTWAAPRRAPFRTPIARRGSRRHTVFFRNLSKRASAPFG